MIAWLRLGRGRVWHVSEPGTVITARPWCGRRAPVEELSKGLPPIGGRVCPSCARLAGELALAVSQASRQDRIVDLSDDGVVDAEIVDGDDGDYLGGNQVGGPPTDDDEPICRHESWEKTGISRRCADCREALPDELAEAATAILEDDGASSWGP